MSVEISPSNQIGFPRKSIHRLPAQSQPQLLGSMEVESCGTGVSPTGLDLCLLAGVMMLTLILGPLTQTVKRSILIHNPHPHPVAFKVKTTAPKQYCVRPNSGRVESGENVEVQGRFSSIINATQTGLGADLL